MNGISKHRWKLMGFDTFSSEWYPLQGSYVTEKDAQTAARRRLAELEKSQPSAQSGGQNGIQDRVFIERPDGTRYQFVGSPEPKPTPKHRKRK